MTQNITEHWEEIKEIKAKIADKAGEQGEFYIVSRNRRKLGIVEGRVSVVTLDQAALHLAAETHELARPEQIAEWKQDQAAKKAAIERKAAEKDTKMSLDLAPFAQLLMEHAAAKSAPVPNNGGKRAPVAE